jgi:hypothetical protein
MSTIFMVRFLKRMNLIGGPLLMGSLLFGHFKLGEDVI